MGKTEEQDISRQNIRQSGDQVKMAGFETLWVWRKAHGLMLEVHQICKKLPMDQKFTRRNQSERSSASVSDNIAEGHTSYYFNDKIKGFYIARKEAGETQNHILALGDQRCLSKEYVADIVLRYEEVIRGINGYVRWIRQKKGVSKS